MKTLVIFFLYFYTLLYAEDFIEYDYEVDIYYTNISAFVDLDSAHEVTDASLENEYEIYRDLLLKTFSPNIFLVEAALYPMPIFGLYFRDNYEDLYVKSNVENSNLVKTLTAGFEEPYSFSLFFGRMMVFKNKDKHNIGKNRAYIGYLLSIGDYTIKDNLAHYNKWINLEFKLKGTRENKDRDLDWSFRVGAKINYNRDFVNTYYIAGRRSSTDYKKSIYSFRYNSAFSSLVEVSADNYKITATEIILEKKIPLNWGTKVALGLGVGYLYNSGSRYRGRLKEDGIDNHQIIFRPNLKF